MLTDLLHTGLTQTFNVLKKKKKKKNSTLKAKKKEMQKNKE